MSIHAITARVLRIISQNDNYQLCQIDIGQSSPQQAVAVVYIKDIGCAHAGDMLIVNSTGVDLKLGTGGYYIAQSNLRQHDYMDCGMSCAQGIKHEGRIIKARYSPSQTSACVLEEDPSPFSTVLQTSHDAQGLKVICCSLHSQIPILAVALKELNARLRIVYIMTDEGSLAASFSKNIEFLHAHNLIVSSISTGQAFGAQFEAVSLHSALISARHVFNADIALVSIGPGTVGTASTWGHTGIAQGESLNACHAVLAQAYACVRGSLKDKRPRHQGFSHHSCLSLERIVLKPVHVALPKQEYLENMLACVPLAYERCMNSLEQWERLGHHIAYYDTSVIDNNHILQDIRSMGRNVLDDQLFTHLCYASALALV